MSAYSEWKCGAISEDEFKSAMERECRDIDPYDRFTCHDCGSYKECRFQVCVEGYPMCETGMDHDEWFEDEYEVNEALEDEAFLMANYGCIDKESIAHDFDIVDIQHDYRNWGK